MLSSLTQNWWAVALRGLAAVILGALVIANPGATLALLIPFLGFFALFAGVMTIISGFAAIGAHGTWWALLLEGVLTFIFGLLALFSPGLTSLSLLWLVAAWSIVGGVLQIISAIRLRREITNEWAMGFCGALSVLFGVLLFAFPGTGLLSLMLLLGWYAVISGVSQIVLGFRLHSYTPKTPQSSARPA